MGKTDYGFVGARNSPPAEEPEAFLECGDNLHAAKEAMHPDDFTAMIRKDLPFDDTKAYRLMQISSNRLVRENVDKMPRAFTILHMVSRLDEKEFIERVEDGTINPDAHEKDIRGKGKHHSEPDYARGVPGKGAHFKTSPSLVPATGDTPGTVLAKRILAAAIELYECLTESGKFSIATLDMAMEEQIETFSKEQREGILAGLRFAVQLSDEAIFKDIDD